MSGRRVTRGDVVDPVVWLAALSSCAYHHISVISRETPAPDRVSMISDSPRFGDLRSLLHAPPSALVWDELLRLLEQPAASEEEAAQRLSYTRAHLSRWPERLRTTPRRWWPALLSTIPGTLPLLELTRTLALAEDDAPPLDPAWFDHLLRRQDLRVCTGLSLRWQPQAHRLLDGWSVAGWVRGLKRLDLWGCELGLAGARQLADTPFARLEVLCLAYTGLDARAMDLLCASPHQAALRTLDLRLNPLGELGVNTLSSATWLRHLEHLNLRACQLAAPELERLIHTPHLASVRTLRLGANTLDAAAAEALSALPDTMPLDELDLGRDLHLDEATSPTLWQARLTGPQRTGTLIPWRTLRHITWLDEVHVMGPDAARVLRAPGLSQLKGLDLHHQALGAPGAAALAQARARATIARLDVSINDLGDDGVAALLGPSWPSLCHLDLGFNGMTDRGVHALTRAHLPAMRTLLLRGNPITDQSVHTLTTTPLAAQLDALGLQQTRLSVDGIAALLAAPHARRWRILDIRYNELGDELVEVLCDGDALRHIETLYLSGNLLTERALERLRAHAQRHHTHLPDGDTDWAAPPPPSR